MRMLHKRTFAQRILCAKERLRVGYALGKLAGLQNLQEAGFDSLVARRKEMIMEVKDLRRGDMVLALRHLDPKGADVHRGTVGVVFEETNFYGDSGGPMVRWMNKGACNVYHGDVVKISGRKQGIDLVDTETGEVLGTI